MDNKPEFIRAILDTRYPAAMHTDCFLHTGRLKENTRWKSFMMNGFWHGQRCASCNELLQCKCSKYKVTEPRTGECKHA